MKRYEVVFAAEAVTDIENLYTFIADRASLTIADRYLSRIERFCNSLETFPHRGTAVPGRINGLRTAGFERRVAILFQLGDEQVLILRVVYGGRDLKPQIEKLVEPE
jgi:toxin ParE1/3/4